MTCRRTTSEQRTAHLVDRVLKGDGRASTQQRANAFSNEGLDPPLDGLIDKVATTPAQVTDADFADARASRFRLQASGFSEDQLFELVVCAAVGHSARLYEAGLAALAAATASGEAR
jgi:hypothetical protein